MCMSGLNVGGFPKERAKDTFLPIPGSFSKAQRDWLSTNKQLEEGFLFFGFFKKNLF